MNRELFIKDFKDAIQLKYKGFKEDCFAKFIKGKFATSALGGGENYNDNYGANFISAPLLQQVVDWFLLKHNILISVIPFDIGFLEKGKFCFQWRIYNNSEDWFTSVMEYATIAEAYNDAIKEAIKLI